MLELLVPNSLVAYHAAEQSLRSHLHTKDLAYRSPQTFKRTQGCLQTNTDGKAAAFKTKQSMLNECPYIWNHETCWQLSCVKVSCDMSYDNLWHDWHIHSAICVTWIAFALHFFMCHCHPLSGERFDEGTCNGTSSIRRSLPWALKRQELLPGKCLRRTLAVGVPP